MSNLSFLRSLCSSVILLFAGAIAVLQPSFAYSSPRLYFTCPTFPPLDELALQAAIAEGDALAASDPLLNMRLRIVEIRTAIEDTERLHNDRG